MPRISASARTKAEKPSRSKKDKPPEMPPGRNYIVDTSTGRTVGSVSFEDCTVTLDEEGFLYVLTQMSGEPTLRALYAPGAWNSVTLIDPVEQPQAQPEPEEEA